jgi:hypothetical protein
MSNGHIETFDKSILKRYKKRYNPEEMQEFVKVCSHCGRGKIYRFGRIWTPCPFCKNIRLYPKIKNK